MLERCLYVVHTACYQLSMETAGKHSSKDCLCRNHVTCLQVQCGFGRVGSHFWGFQLQSVVPDMVTLGKPIGNGFPMGAVIMSQKLAKGFSNGMEYFNTCGGCTGAAAAGECVLADTAYFSYTCI